MAYTTLLERNWYPGIPHTAQLRYQTVVYFTNWNVLVGYNNWNIINFTNKTTYVEEFDNVPRVVFGNISDNMASIVNTGNYVAINTLYSTKMGCYVSKFLYETVTLQEDNTPNGNILKADYIAVKASHLISM